MKNKKLNKAKKNKNDEFYTRLTDIEKELFYYKDHFKDKTIYCNCDDPEESNFYKYFSLNFEFFGLKKLITTHYDSKKPTYKLELTKYGEKPIKTQLRGNGDFENNENIELLKEADIVVTNPPFSLFRKYISQLMDYNKKFIIIGNLNAITYKIMFPWLNDGKIHLGKRRVNEFISPNGDIVTAPGLWFTNIKIKYYKESLLKMLMGNKYDPDIHKKADNCDCIVINKTLDIPYDYDGLMAVPITFLEKYDFKDFEILGIDKEFTTDKKTPIVNGKRKYDRLIIKRRK